MTDSVDSLLDQWGIKPPKVTQARRRTLPWHLIAKPSAAQHMSNTVEHYGPAHLVESARVVLGGIELDPASCEEANKIVKADRYYTKDNDGFGSPWGARTVYCNPPGGIATKVERDATGCRSRQAAWWQRAVWAVENGETKAVIFVGFNLGLMRTAQRATSHPTDWTYCLPKKRIRFRGDHPTHDNVIVLLTSAAVRTEVAKRFRFEFEKLGIVR